MLGSVPADDVTVVADLEAGIGTLTRLEEARVDVTVIVVEPTPRSINVAARAAAVAAERRQGRMIAVANKVTSDDDRQRVADALGGCEVVAVPLDAAVEEADRDGVSPLDRAPSAPAVAALESLADLIAPPTPKPRSRAETENDAESGQAAGLRAEDRID